jgi:hypothetical protein
MELTEARPPAVAAVTESKRLGLFERYLTVWAASAWWSA